jgi:CHAT domain-containing protein/Tfp pilus assembly protein PilF
MRASKRGRGVRFWKLRLSIFLLGMLATFTGHAVAADPSPPHKAAPLSDADRKKLLAERDRFSEESQKHQLKGESAEAIAAAEKMLDIERKVLGDFNEDVVGSLERLAQLHASRDEFASARRAQQEVVAIRSKLYGEKDWRVTDSRQALEWTTRLPQFSAAERRKLDEARLMTQQASRLTQMQQYRKALILFEKSLAIYKELVGDKHPDYCALVYNVAHQYNNLGNFDKAEPLYLQACELARINLGEFHPNYANCLGGLAGLYYGHGDFAKAESYDRRVIAIRKKTVGEAHPEYAKSLNNLGVLLWSEAKYAEAESLLQQASEVYAAGLGKAHGAYAQSLNQLASMYRDQGNYAKSERFFWQALEVDRKVVGDRRRGQATDLNNLALLFMEQGDSAKAEALLRQVVDLTNEAVGPEHPDYATCLVNLASEYVREGDSARAEPLLLQAAEITKNALGETNYKYLGSLSSLAGFYWSQGNYKKAEPLYRRMLELQSKTYGGRLTVAGIGVQALLSLRNGEYAKAEALYKSLLAGYKTSELKERPHYADSLYSLARLYEVQGEFAKAEPLFRQALEIRKKTLGEEHPSYAQSLNSMAFMYFWQGHTAKAEPLCRQALEIYERQMATALQMQSERRLLATALQKRLNLDYFLLVTAGAGSTTSAADVYRHVLSWKGIVFASQLMARRARSKPELSPLFEELSGVSTRLATLSLSVPDPAGHGRWLRQVAELTNRKEDLERELAAKSAEFRHAQETMRLTPEQLQHVLKEDAVLIDFLEFTDAKRAAPKERPKLEQRLVAFVVRSGRPIVRVDLGPVEPLAKAADLWRRALLGGSLEQAEKAPADSRGAAAVSPPENLLRQRLWEPLLPHMSGANLVMISPDGFLNQIPLAALPGKAPGTYLIEDTRLLTVPVPRELPDLLNVGDTQPQRGQPSLLLVGNVDFGPDSGLLSIADSSRAPSIGRPRAAARGSNGMVFGPLPGTAAELKEVAELFHAQFPGHADEALQGAAATEDAFRRQASRHRWIHLATHGFFAPESVRSGLDRRSDEEPRVHGELFGNADEVRGFHPGLLSGIALAGANGGSRLQTSVSPNSGRQIDDGILTALEVAGLDLRDVDLVVLSACETGLGRVAGGEGVLGLQRAFQIAGAKNVVASLWKVDDRATALLMKRFYQKLWKEKKPAAIALREAQIDLLHHPEEIESLATRGPNFEKTVKLVDHGQRTAKAPTSSPRYWAAFVVSGTGM